jgi:SAM-dependent methyltransferase
MIEQERDAFIERLLKSAGGVFDLFSVYIGDQLGYYRALKDNWLTSAQLASQTKTNERYTREWLEQQTVSGILQVEDDSADAASRRFRLPEAHADVLTERDSLNYLTPLAQLVVSVTRPVEQLLDAYRTGKGVPYSAYGRDMVEGQGAMNRSTFLQEIGSSWLPSIPDLHSRLQADPPARVADFGCGVGWSSIGIAQTYPKVLVDGYDLDAPSIDAANANARDMNISDRVKFHVRDAGDLALAGQYDLVTAFECVHDMSNPVAALQSMRRLAGRGGTVLIVDERVGDRFTAKGNDVEWMMYGWSVLHCLPVGMEEKPSAETGTVMRSDTLRRYATDAGFREVEVLPIENFFFRIYRLIP